MNPLQYIKHKRDNSTKQYTRFCSTFPLHLHTCLSLFGKLVDELHQLKDLSCRAEVSALMIFDTNNQISLSLLL